MTSKTFGVELLGLEGRLIEIETDTRSGLPAFTIVGLPDTAVQESRERVRSAIKSSELPFPRGKVVINLAPADVRKVGGRHDLAIALGILSACELLSEEQTGGCLFLGELALSGHIRPVTGVLPSVEFARAQGFKRVFVPRENAAEAALIGGIEVVGVGHLREAMLHLKGVLSPLPISSGERPKRPEPLVDLAMVRGQGQAKRALEIAAVGGHNLLFEGAPGAGKSLMAQALSGILPSMTDAEKLEVTKIHSVAGLLRGSGQLITERPFRKVHHSASALSLTGGGSAPIPGEITLAHRGVLFMDEIAEFPVGTLETLRQPLEDGSVRISRVRGSVTYPARFMLVAAMNPCPCGYHNVERAARACSCAAWKVAKYQKKLSGPLLDRIDLHLRINPVETGDLLNERLGESSAQVRSRVETARELARERLRESGLSGNAEMGNEQLTKLCQLGPHAKETLERAATHFHLSARSYFRIIKVARSIADLAGSDAIGSDHIAESLHYRKK